MAFVHIGEPPRLEDARAVKETVDAAKLGQRRIDHCGHRGGVGDVHRHKADGRSRLLYLGERRLTRGLVDVGKDDAGAFLGKEFGRSQPNARRTAGDQYNSFTKTHVLLLPFTINEGRGEN